VDHRADHQHQWRIPDHLASAALTIRSPKGLYREDLNHCRSRSLARPSASTPYDRILRAGTSIARRTISHPEVRATFAPAVLRFLLLRPKRLEIGTHSAEAIFDSGVRGP
jgi:hypothetical protein